MTYIFTITGRLKGLNDYIKACRTNPHVGNKLKKDAEDTVLWPLRNELRGVHINRPVILKYDFYEPNKRRDLDNVASFAMKVIQDALVKAGVLKNDGWEQILGFTTQFYCDPKRPRIEVTIVEGGD